MNSYFLEINLKLIMIFKKLFLKWKVWKLLSPLVATGA